MNSVMMYNHVVQEKGPPTEFKQTAHLPLPLPVTLPAKMNRGRRVSVSAESDRNDNDQKAARRVIPKTEEARQRIQKAIANSFLFVGLEPEQRKQIIDAMEEVRVKPNDQIITQGSDGDNFYVVESGKYEVFKKLGGEEKKVFQYDECGSFGELALMYNAPRAASVRATTAGVLWAVDRITFRTIIIDSQARKRSTYESFLQHVHLFANLTRAELSQIADCLESLPFNDGEYILRQGEKGDTFYIIVEGEVLATQMPHGAEREKEVGRMKVGDYFGERALLTHQPRAANVIAVGNVKLAAMDRSAFERLLGDCKDLMQRKIAQYKTAS